MANHNVVFVADLDTELPISGGKVTVKLDGTLQKNADGSIGLSSGSLTIVSPDAGNIIVPDSNGKAFLDAAAIAAVETVWQGSEADGFLSITPGGTNGHDVTYGFDWTNPAFVEAVQDAIGQAALAGAGITYDDVANAISTSLGNITFGSGLNFNAGTDTVSVLPDPASPALITVTAAGVSVQATVSTDSGNLLVNGADNRPLLLPSAVTGLATDIICDAAGNQRFRAFSI